MFVPEVMPPVGLGHYIPRNEVYVANDNVIEQIKGNRPLRMHATDWKWILFQGLSGVGKTEAARQVVNLVRRSQLPVRVLYTFYLCTETEHTLPERFVVDCTSVMDADTSCILFNSIILFLSTQ